MSSIESDTVGPDAAGAGRRASTGLLSSQFPPSRSRPAQGTRAAIATPELGPSMPRLPNEKVVASGSGVTVSTSLTEPVLFLEGYARNDREMRKAAVLRGRLHLNVTKPLKIKKVYLTFRGQAIMTLPEEENRVNRVPGKRLQRQRKYGVMNHTWTFFNAQFPTAERGYGADRVRISEDSAGMVAKEADASELATSTIALAAAGRNRSATTSAAPKELKRLSLQHVQSRSFGTDSFSAGPTVAQRGYKWFLPGDYVYNFELPIDSWNPETLQSEFATVKYELEAMVERAGAFRPNLVGTREIPFVRTPSDGSLEHVEPIAITRTWDEQLHYEVIISGKAFPMGAKVPIAFKLTPLAKVACHRVRVYVTESVQKWSESGSTHHIDICKKLMLFEKRPDAPFVSAFPGSSVRVTAGGGIAPGRQSAAAHGEEVVDPDKTNLLGEIESDFGVGTTEMEFDVQLPTCAMMRNRGLSDRLHPDASYGRLELGHWIKIVLRLSRPDEADPGKRRYFEISIDSPFHIMSCLARQANIYLPAYSAPSSTPPEGLDCGCPDSGQINPLSSPNSSRTGDPCSEVQQNEGESSLHASRAVGDRSTQQQPFPLFRIPSYAPPPFEEAAPPPPPAPPLVTPPPDYASAVTNGDPENGPADYFGRLRRAEQELDDNARGTGRVDIPLTPGGRVHRSMDMSREWTPIGEAIGQNS